MQILTKACYDLVVAQKVCQARKLRARSRGGTQRSPATVKGEFLSLAGVRGPAGAGGASPAHSTEPLVADKHVCTHTLAQVRCLTKVAAGRCEVAGGH